MPPSRRSASVISMFNPSLIRQVEAYSCAFHWRKGLRYPIQISLHGCDVDGVLQVWRCGDRPRCSGFIKALWTRIEVGGGLPGFLGIAPGVKALLRLSGGGLTVSPYTPLDTRTVGHLSAGVLYSPSSRPLHRP